ncbi:hypothetical protein ACFSL6_16390 [Paenibacillus thailandensis]|uniref:Tetratricopeptide repeat protein n=1 Tax=Paenibacillus thailandensis TaxID=393250 RepID=A0ABW5QZM6_9BACL
MFQHLFAVMNETLDQIVQEYASSPPERRVQLEEQLGLLKKASDSLIEQWLVFEEKLSEFQHLQQAFPAAPVPPASGGCQTEAAAELAYSDKQQAAAFDAPSGETALEGGDALSLTDQAAEFFTLGQGYYKLFMFHEADRFFHKAQHECPESNLIRLYLGMTNMHLQNWNEAHRHFQMLVALTDFPKWQALGYNALGCIQAVRRNMEYAEKLFMKAYEVYPEFTDSLYNMKSCKESPQQLSLFFGSTELCCL